MLFRWFDFKQVKFCGGVNGRMKNIRNVHDLSDYNCKLAEEMMQVKDSLVEIGKRSDEFLSLMASHIPVPPPRHTPIHMELFMQCLWIKLGIFTTTCLSA